MALQNINVYYVGDRTTKDLIKVTFVNVPDTSTKEAARYVEYVLANVKIENTPLAEVVVTMCDDGKVDVEYLFKGEPFERIRRITGYLTGTLETWNNAKRSEERERVKHNGRCCNV